MRRLIVMAAVAAMLAPVSARAEQAKTETTVDDPRAVGEWTWGVKGGVNLGTFFGDDPNPSANSSDPTLHIGVALGAFGTWKLTPELALQTELFMVEKGADFEDLNGETFDEGYLYVELPILARYDYAIDGTFNVFGVVGPTLGYMIDSKAREKDELNLFDVGATAGVGTDIKVGSNLIVIDVRYSVGFLDTLDLEDAGRSARTRVLSFLLGFTT